MASRRPFVSLLSLVPLLFASAVAPACADPTDAPVSDEDDYTSKGKMELLVTVDWEGSDLTDENLHAMQALEAKFPDIRIVQFLNAAYYTKRGADAANVTSRIKSAIGPNDEKGLHIHGWKRLFESAGVTFKNTPTFWGSSLDERDCADDCGHEVPISEYSTEDLRKVVKLSLDTLDANGFGRPKSFRTGGWMAQPGVRDAVAAEGITYEHSAVPVEFLQPKLGTYPLYGWLSDLWQGTTPTSQPFRITTVAGDLVEVPDNGCLSDYMSADQMVSVFEANKTAFLANRRENVVVSIGFHQETAATYVPVLEEALGRILDEANREHLPLVSVTSSEIAAAK